MIKIRNGKRLIGAKGLSYVETVLAAAIMSGLLLAGLVLMGNLGRSRQSSTDAEAASWLVINMLEELENQSYSDPDDQEADIGADEDDETRQLFDDIDDYDDWSACPPEYQDGSTYSQYSHLTRSVAVGYVSSANLATPTGSNEGFKEVTITVSRNGTNIEQRKFVFANTD